MHLVTADQCAYGLATPSQADGMAAPAMKPTNFLTSSPFMAKRLQARCDHSHVHQQLTGGRCKDAAHYPLQLIRSIPGGIRDTSVAGVNLVEENDELVKTLNALGDHPMEYPKVVERQDVVKESRIEKTNGGDLHNNYDFWRPRYVDDYTGEVLQDNLIDDAMIDELDWFNEHVWEVETLEHLRAVPDYILVRSRWVMCPSSLRHAETARSSSSANFR